MLLDESDQDSQSESGAFPYADLKFGGPNSESHPSPALFSNASGFGIGRQATFDTANTIDVLHRRWKEYQLVRAVPPGYHEGMSDCPAHTQYFTGRQDVLNVMEEYLINSPPSVKMGHQKIFLLFGLDGAGKTQSALAFAHKFKSCFTKIYFVHANSEGDIQASYYDIAAGNELPTPHLSWNSGHRWFQTHKEEWLIIMDNADEPKLSLADFIPDCAHGNIIITSRNQELVKIAGKYKEIKDMDPENGTHLLLKHALPNHEANEEETDLAAAIAKELCYFALALVQAGAYIEQQQCLHTYLDKLHSQQAELRARNMSQSLDRYRLSVYSTWNLSWDKLDESCRIFLQLCSCLHYKGIPRMLFQKALEGMDHIWQPLGPGTAAPETINLLGRVFTLKEQWDSLKLEGIVSETTAYSLIKVAQDDLLEVHPLVHEWIYDGMDKARAREIMLGVKEMITASISNVQDDDIAFLRILTPHCTTETFKMLHAKESHVMWAIGKLWNMTGKFKEAVGAWQPLVDNLKKVLGDEHPNTLSVETAIANAFGHMGRNTEALNLKEGLVAKSKRFLGEDHPNTLSHESRLAENYQVLGRYTEALGVREAQLQTSKRVFGQDHPETLRYIEALKSTHQDSNKQQVALQLQNSMQELLKLANMYRALGRHTEALNIQVLLYETFQRNLGDRHPITLDSMDELAATHKSLGKYDVALHLQEALLETSKEIFGDEHPNTFKRTNELAATYFALGRQNEALHLQKATFETAKQTWGEKHLDTLSCMKNLISTYLALDRRSEILELQERFFQLSKQIFGPDHPDTLDSTKDLASTYKQIGQYAEALPLDEMLVDASAKMMGENHPDTLAVINTLAETYHALARYDEALPFREFLMEGREENHPDFWVFKKNLAATYKCLRRSDEALSFYMALYNHSKATFGDSHIETITFKNDLASTYHALGKDKQALELWERLIETYVSVLGEANPETLKCKNNVARIYRSQGRHKEALHLQESLYKASKQVLEADNQDILMYQNELLETYQALEQQTGDLHEELMLKMSKQTLGHEHPITLTHTRNLADKYWVTGHHGEAVLLQEKLFSMSKQVLGEEHSDTLNCEKKLISMYQALKGSENTISHEYDQSPLVNHDAAPQSDHEGHPEGIMEVSSYVMAANGQVDVPNNAMSDKGYHEDSIDLPQDQHRVQSSGEDHNQMAQVKEPLVTVKNISTSIQGVFLPDDLSKKGLKGSNDLSLNHKGDFAELPRRSRESETPKFKSDLAAMYWALGEHDEAIQLEEAVFGIPTGALPENHLLDIKHVAKRPNQSTVAQLELVASDKGTLNAIPVIGSSTRSDSLRTVRDSLAVRDDDGRAALDDDGGPIRHARTVRDDDGRTARDNGGNAVRGAEQGLILRDHDGYTLLNEDARTLQEVPEPGRRSPSIMEAVPSPRTRTRSPWFNDLSQAEEELDRLARLYDVEHRLNEVAEGARKAEHQPEAEFQDKERQREEDFRESEQDRQKIFQENEARAHDATETREALLHDFAGGLEPVPPAGAAGSVSAVPIVAEDLERNSIHTIQDIRDTASIHSPEIWEIIDVERKQNAREREAAAAERERLKTERDAAIQAAQELKDSRMELEEELASLRASFETKKQSMEAKEVNAHERERAGWGEPNEYIRSQLMDLTNLMNEQRHALRGFSDIWRNEYEQSHAEIINAVRETANEQVPYNIQGYLDEFSKALASEVRILVGEVGKLREERRYLQHEIGYLLTLKSNYGPGGEFEPDWKPPPGALGGPSVPSPPPPPPEVPPVRPAWRSFTQRMRNQKKETAPPPQLDPKTQVRSWATWQPDPNLAPTPTSFEPTLLVFDRGSPGLFGPRSPPEPRI